MTSVFLSYARGDDGEPFDRAMSFVARLHRDLTAAGFDLWFDRVSMPSRALTFHQEIRDAVAACHRLVLVVGPKAAESLYVRQEWQFAYFEAEKIVTPILRCGDYKHVPDELKLLHCEDFRDDGQYDFHLKNLIRQLTEPTPALGKLIGVPSLPPHFLSRTDRLTALRDALRADLDRPVVITGAAARVGMHGMGGIGKSVLAATLSRDRKVREAFPDGIVWVGLGPLPTVADLQRRVHKDLGGDGAFQTEHEGRVKLRDILKDKGILLILDDVWRRADVDWFDVLGPRCRAMITTRDAGLLTSLGGVHHQVELLTDAEALNLLAQAAGVERDKLPSEAADLIAECGRLPLAVALCAGMVLGGTPWRHLIEALREHELEFPSDPQSAQSQHTNLWRAMELSVQKLAEHAGEEPLLTDAGRRFAELAVFPSDEPTPVAAICTLWSHTGGLGERHTHKLLMLLKQRSLVQMSGGTVSLHALLFDLAIRLSQRDIGDVKLLNHLIVEAYRKKCPDGWHVDPPNDGYFFTHLRHHLVTAGRASELADLLHELRWLEAKNEAGLTFDLTEDFAEAMNALPETDARQRNLRLLDEALRRDIHFIARHAKDYPQGLFQCLWNSCWWYDCADAAMHYEIPRGTETAPLPWERLPEERVSTLLERWREKRERQTPGFYWLRSLRPPLLHLGTAQKAVLRGHTKPVLSVAISPDGQRIVSGSSDHTVRVWDTSSGAELLCLRGHEGSVYSVAYSPNGQYIASGSVDGTVRIWDATWGGEARCLRGHQDDVRTVAFSPDGRLLASGGNVVRIWDVASGAELRWFGFGNVRSVAISADSRRVAFAVSWELFVKDIAGDRLYLNLPGKEGDVSSVTFSPDGQRLVGGYHDHCELGSGTLRVWNATTGAAIHRLDVGGDVNSVAFSPDGELIASGSEYGTLQVWDAATGERVHRLEGHEDAVYSVIFSMDGQRIISGSSDSTIRVWDFGIAAEPRKLRCDDDDDTYFMFSPDGRYLATWRRLDPSDGPVVTIWDAGTGAQLYGLRGHKQRITCVAFSQNGSRIVTGTADESVRVWDAANGADLQCLLIKRIECVAISPDGDRVASVALCNPGDSVSSYKYEVRIWDSSAAAELHRLEDHQKNGTVAFVDGQRLLSGDGVGKVRLWDVTSGSELVSEQWDESGIDYFVYSADYHRLAFFSWSNKCYYILDFANGNALSQADHGDWDVAAMIAGTALPFRGMSRESETVIESSVARQGVAWYPLALDEITSHRSGRTWAGRAAKSYCHFTLEGT